MEAYLEAIDVGVYRATAQGFLKPKDPANLVGDEVHYKKWNARTYLTVCGTTKMSMHYGRTFVRSMRKPRVSVRNAITL